MSSRHHQITGNINSFNSIVNFNAEIDAEGGQIMQWLSPLEPQQRHQGVRTDRLDSVGKWVLETNEFKEWSDAEEGCVEPVFFCHGNPGVGKTYLSSLVIDSLCDRAGGKDIAIVGLYCDFLAQQEQSATSMLGAILKQLISRGGIPEHIREAFQRAKGEFGGRGLRGPELVENLTKTIASLPRVFVCIDALDESPPKHRRELLSSLREIVRASPNTRIFLTGRPHIDDEIVIYFSKAVRIPVTPTQDDIKSYLEMKLDGDTDPNAMDEQLRADIMRIIPEKVSEIFLLVSLKIDAILGEITLHQRRKKLDKMIRGEGLGHAYAATLSRVRAQQRSRSKLGMEVLMWVSHSERPLHVDELCHALGVEVGSLDLNVQNIPAIKTLLACTLGLVTVEESSSTVRLVHYTLQEYLSHNSSLFLKPHSMIAEVCLAYLNFRCVWAVSPTLDLVPPTIPFAEYASCHWGTHARREATEGVKALALKLLGGYDNHISSKMLFLHETDIWEEDPDWEGSDVGFTGLHGAALFGLEEITTALLELSRWDVGATDFNGDTAITWAARKGHEGVVKILLERNDVDPNATFSEYSRTPLAWAAGGGHEGVVKMLLGRSDVNPNTADTEYNRTPLSWAAENGHGRIVKILLDRNDVNPNTSDNEYGRTPLLWAVESGHEKVVKIILERNDANPEKADRWDRTALSWAVENGREEVVRILLERSDVNPDKANRWNRTPLSWAAENGHEGVVKTLLDRKGVNPNTADTVYGRTPLLRAAKYGHKRVVKILLERSDVNPNIVDTKYDLTPLSWAAESGNEGVVKILLGRNDVNPNAADAKYGRTPLSWAAKNGHEGVVKMLLERNDVNPNAADAKYGRTPLSWAAKNGHERVVKILLERNDTNPNTADTKYGQTPLLWAAKGGHERVVKILLKQDDVNPNTADTEYGLTPLLWAAKDGHEKATKILLERNDVNPNATDAVYGLTPLSWAAKNGHEGPVRALLERNDTNPNIADNKYGRTSLSWATKSGRERIAKLLQARTEFIPRYPATLQSTEVSPSEPSELSEPPSRRAGKFWYPGLDPGTSPSIYHIILDILFQQRYGTSRPLA